MFSFITVRVLLLAVSFVSMIVGPYAIQSHVTPVAKNTVIIEPVLPPVVENSNFYTFRPDMRRCASPMCGGYFVKRVNQSVTKCANGRAMSECYVVSIDWNGSAEVESKRALVRGTLTVGGDRKGKYGVLKVTEAWQAVNSAEPNGEYFRVRDMNIRCIAAPCESHRGWRLNTNFERVIAGVNLPSEEQTEKLSRAMKSEQGVLVTGSLADVSGPARRSKTLNASRVYLRANTSLALKPCIKTGCSNEICAEESVMSTCDYKPEYECYKKAKCERQPDGNCGFTKSPEVKSCLARK